MATSCFQAAGCHEKANALLVPQYFESADDACEVLEAELSQRHLTVDFVCADPFFFESGVGAFAGGGGTQVLTCSEIFKERGMRVLAVQQPVLLEGCGSNQEENPKAGRCHPSLCCIVTLSFCSDNS